MCKYCEELAELAQDEDALDEGFVPMALQQISRMSKELGPLMEDVRDVNGRVPYDHDRVKHLCELIGMRLSAIYNRAIAGAMATDRIAEFPNEDEDEVWHIASKGMADVPPSMVMGLMAGEFLKVEQQSAMDSVIQEFFFGGLSMN